jgi:hypothetical protein
VYSCKSEPGSAHGVCRREKEATHRSSAGEGVPRTSIEDLEGSERGDGALVAAEVGRTCFGAAVRGTKWEVDQQPTEGILRSLFSHRTAASAEPQAGPAGMFSSITVR